MTNDSINNTTDNDQPKEGALADQFEELRQIELEGYELAVKKARNALFWTAGLIFFWEMFAIWKDTGSFDPFVLAFASGVAAIFIGLALWTKKKPYTALITGIIVFVLYIALVVVVNGMAEGIKGVLAGLFSGIIVKILIFINLFRPIKDAKLLQEAKDQRS